ncbi:MAG TPA: alpha-L-arabinofuranosidase C-terminal domain-containing protein, partial [Verrucomicrobiae bacterium]|nr:alpha-L-arabinofuranosidase C-terminal domain-containing protein [Verrucomicrobiae bacterium]
TDEFLRMSPEYARKYDRGGPEIFVGEWAAHEDARIRPWNAETHRQPPTPSMKAAIGDAVFMAAMERNSDLIKMHCYAPLLVNVNPGARQWRPNLIGYDALSSFGSPSYFAFRMFSRNVGNQLLPVATTNTSVQGCATRDDKTGETFIKLVNPDSNSLPLNINFKHVRSLERIGTAIVLSGDPDEINSLAAPRKISPTVRKLTAISSAFRWTMPPTSVVVLRLREKH